MISFDLHQGPSGPFFCACVVTLLTAFNSVGYNDNASVIDALNLANRI